MTPRYIITKERTNVPNGFRNLTEQEIANQFLKLDVDKDYFISKNEWMLNCIKLLGEDIAALDAEAPDAIMEKIQQLSAEFDTYDLDGNRYIDYLEYKNFLLSNILVSD
jgi:Ca2+-binding EF-hand superfamily protein